MNHGEEKKYQFKLRKLIELETQKLWMETQIHLEAYVWPWSPAWKA